MKNCLLLVRLTVLLLLVRPATAQTSGNPILTGYHADPEMDYFNGRYYIYPTSNEGIGGQDFHAYSSADLTNWRDDGVANTTVLPTELLADGLYTARLTVAGSTQRCAVVVMH